jgi:hypothetical protein
MTPSSETLNENRWYSVTLRLFGDSLDLEEAQREFSSLPLQLCRKGEHIRQNPRYARNHTNLCLVRLGKSSTEPWEPRLLRLLEVAEPRASWLSRIQQSGVVTEAYLGYASETGQGGGSISAETLSRVAALGLSFALDLYPPIPDGPP